MTDDLFSLDRALTPAERKKLTRKGPVPRGHAWAPGTGPEGETCGSCLHLYRNRMSKTYLKCGLNRAKWTGGGASDVRARDAACKKWEALRALASQPRDGDAEPPGKNDEADDRHDRPQDIGNRRRQGREVDDDRHNDAENGDKKQSA